MREAIVFLLVVVAVMLFLTYRESSLLKKRVNNVYVLNLNLDEDEFIREVELEEVKEQFTKALENVKVRKRIKKRVKKDLWKKVLPSLGKVTEEKIAAALRVVKRSLKDGNRDKAAEVFFRLVVSKPEYVKYDEWGLIDYLIKKYEQKKALNPKDWVVRVRLGWLYYRRTRLKDSLYEFIKAYKIADSEGISSHVLKKIGWWVAKVKGELKYILKEGAR